MPQLPPSGEDEIAASTRRFRLIVERDTLPALTAWFSRWFSRLQINSI